MVDPPSCLCRGEGPGGGLSEVAYVGELGVAAQGSSISLPSESKPFKCGIFAHQEPGIPLAASSCLFL